MEVIRITEDDDFPKPSCVEAIKTKIRGKPGTSLHGSLPCTVWSTWQYMSIKKHGTQYEKKLSKRRAKSLKLLKSFIECAELALSLGGEVSFEWPRHCTGWLQKPLVEFIHRNNLYTANVDGCACGMVNTAGEPLLKQWRFVCSSARMAISLSELRCQHPSDFKHGVIQGSTTKGTETYPLKLCRTMLSSTFGYHNFAPAMMCLPVNAVQPDSLCQATAVQPGSHCSSCAPAATRATQKQPHREHEVVLGDFRVSEFLDSDIPLAVHKLLDRKEIWSNKGAMEALATEKAGLLKQRTWLEETVTEKEKLVSDARANGKKIHLGELMPIASIKHESPLLWKYRGALSFVVTM